MVVCTHEPTRPTPLASFIAVQGWGLAQVPEYALRDLTRPALNFLLAARHYLTALYLYSQCSPCLLGDWRLSQPTIHRPCTRAYNRAISAQLHNSTSVATATLNHDV